MIRKRNIPAPPRACAACDAAFKKGQSVHCALFEEGDRWVRSSWCEECWNPEEHSSGCLSHWKGVFDSAQEKRKLPPDALVELLRRACGEERWRPIAALLGWHLVRRKLMKFRGKETGEGEDYLVFAPTGSEDTVRVPDVDQSEQDIQAFNELIEAVEDISEQGNAQS